MFAAVSFSLTDYLSCLIVLKYICTSCLSIRPNLLGIDWVFVEADYYRLFFFHRRHSELKEGEGFYAGEDTLHDLFSLQIKLSVSGETNSLVVKISWKV